MNDKQLLRRAAAGDHRSLERFYEDHVDAVYAFVFYRVGKNRVWAEDAVAETFARALSERRKFDPSRGSLRSWLITLSKNASRDQLREHQQHHDIERWEEVDQALSAFASLQQAPLSDELLAHAETRDMVNMTMCHLPERYGRALKGKYIEGASLREIARDLGTTEEAAKSLLARARRAFRDAFSTLTQTITTSDGASR
ncbi:MAG: RNA polymerase sigma factor [Myxococcota bacterium]